MVEQFKFVALVITAVSPVDIIAAGMEIVPQRPKLNLPSRRLSRKNKYLLITAY